MAPIIDNLVEQTEVIEQLDNLSAVLYGVDNLKLEQRPLPVPGPGQLLIRVKVVGICGSDVHYWTHGNIGSFCVKDPMVLGHESSGVVEEVGPNVRGFAVGDRITMEPGIPCKGCSQCKTGCYNLCQHMRFHATPPIDGSLARYVVHDADFCYKIPEHVTYEEASLLEPLSVAVHTCARARLQMGHRVLVLGAGPIGILCMMTAKAQGAARVVMTDICDNRLALAKKLGADATLNVKGLSINEVKSAAIKLLGDEPNVSMECSGAQPSMETAILTTRSGGVVVLVGLGAARTELPIIEAACREVDIRGIFRYANCYPVALELVASGRIDLSGITRAHYQLEDTVEAFRRAQKADVIKVFIHC